MSRGYVLFDVDGTLVDNQGEPIHETLGVVRLVRLLDFEIRLWSAAGYAHAWHVNDELGIRADWIYTKPDPVTEQGALRLLRDPPALQVDNDPSHRIGDWPFLRVAS